MGLTKVDEEHEFLGESTDAIECPAVQQSLNDRLSIWFDHWTRSHENLQNNG